LDDFLIKNKIRELRSERRLTQWKLALAIGIAESRMCILEQGAPPRPKEITKLVSFFGLKAEEIWPESESHG